MTRFYLADWCVDTDANRLFRDGVDIRLESKVMAVLHYLAEHRGEPVTRAALEAAVWGDTVVGYDALTRCIAKLRKILDDDPRRPRYIETISKKGYRLIAAVSEQAPAGDGSARRGERRLRPARQLLIAGLSALLVGVTIYFAYPRPVPDPVGLAPSTGRPSIAVVPFVDISDDWDGRYFSAGMTDDITTALSKLSGLFVISPYSVSGYRETALDAAQVAATLGVRYLVKGSVRRSRDRLRVTTHLIDTASGVYLWSEKYDKALQNVFDMQDDITAKIIAALSVRLTAAETRRTAMRYTHSVAAYDDFLHGQAFYSRHARDDNLLARALYQRAIDRDATFARAYSAMALTFVAEQRYGWSKSVAFPLDKALQLASRGVVLDGELPQAHWALAYVHLFRQEYPQAAAAADRAVALDPNYADSYVTLAICRLYFQAPAAAVKLVRKAMLLNPQYPAAYASVLGQAYYFMGAYAQATPRLYEAIERNASLITPYVFLTAALGKLEQREDATWTVHQLKTIAPDFSLEQVGEMLAARDASVVEDIQQQLRNAGF